MASQSEELAQVIREFVDSMNSGDPERVVSVLSPSNELLVIGTDADEWMDDAAAIREAFRSEASLSIQSKINNVTAYQEGDGFGWAAARAAVTLPDGNTLRTRWTAVMRKEEGEWKIAHSHLSVPADAAG